MQILAHRGEWTQASEQNSLNAIARAFQNNFGVETDIRDSNGVVVISHDCPTASNLMTLDDLLEVYKTYNMNLPLALNVKADGLQDKCKDALRRHNIDLTNIFFFDMSIPDGLVYLKEKLPCFTRYSDEELHPSFLERACGIWADGFQSDCTDQDVFRKFIERGIPVCLVSPELHKRNHKDVWQKWRFAFKDNKKAFMICTDFPQEADEFFND